MLFCYLLYQILCRVIQSVICIDPSLLFLMHYQQINKDGFEWNQWPVKGLLQNLLNQEIFVSPISANV